MSTEQKSRAWLSIIAQFPELSSTEESAKEIITALLKENRALLDLVTEAPCYFAPQHDFEGRKLAWTLKANKAHSHAQGAKQ